MTLQLDSAPVPTAGLLKGRPLMRAAIIDAAARCIARRGDHRLRWAAIAYEAGDATVVGAADRFENFDALLDECYARSAQGLADSLLRAETAPGTGLDKVAAFIVAALEIRRARGVLLSFRRGADLPAPLRRRLNEHDTALRMRLKRLLSKGRRDGSLALRNTDSAVELLLASLQVPTVVVDGPEQRMWDSELGELLLAALAEPHPPEPERLDPVAVVQGSCLCGRVRYELTGALELQSHCQCSMCRRHHGTVFANFLAVPVAGFRWVSGAANITRYESPEGGRRAFCTTCGTVTPIVDEEAGTAFCPAGNLDGEFGAQSRSHRHVGSKLSWHPAPDPD